MPTITNFEHQHIHVKMLMLDRIIAEGMTLEKAEAIVAVYPTPGALGRVFIDSQNPNMLVALKYGSEQRNVLMPM